VPKNVFNLGVDYKMPISGEWAVDYRADGIYRTSAPGAIPGIFLSNWTMPSSKIIDANVTLEKGKQWGFELYGTNLTSDPGYTAATGQQGTPVNTFENRVVTRPRTVGVLIHYHFE
jgi:outer membrane receptor protein involved in Fe transport